MVSGNGVDDYLETVVGAGGEMSHLLEERFASTLKNGGLVNVLRGQNEVEINRIKTITPPAGMLGVVCSLGGNHELNDAREYAGSAIDRVVEAMHLVGATPAALANVIDARVGEKDIVLPYADAMVDRANHFRLPVVNGEFAVLGNRMRADANVSMTALGFIPKNANLPIDEVPFYFKQKGIRFAVFDPEGKPVFMNSDGVGTKTACYERAGNLGGAFIDSLAMKLDDLAKIGAKARVVSDVAEINLHHQLESIGRSFLGLGFAGIKDSSNIVYIVQPEFIAGRLNPRMENAFTYNVSGSSVSTIDEKRLQNLPRPSEGEQLIAIRGKTSNPRSNGITDMRKVMVEMFGDDWHTKTEARHLLEFLTTPSDVFYPVFRSLINNDLAGSVYHMSGGAFNGKLAKPLAKYGLFVDVEGLFPADERALAIARHRNNGNEASYGKWPMGNPGFISTRNPDRALEMIAEYGFDGRVVGRLVKDAGGLTGVRLRDIKASNGEPVYYSGRN
ncbi:MAG: hypothetical protein AABX35_04725 [Nanoarchaeota archaeon]